MNNYVTDSTHTTLTDLHPFYTYSISVAAETVDIGPFTAEVTAQMPEDGKYNAKITLSLFISTCCDVSHFLHTQFQQVRHLI